MGFAQYVGCSAITFLIPRVNVLSVAWAIWIGIGAIMTVSAMTADGFADMITKMDIASNAKCLVHIIG